MKKLLKTCKVRRGETGERAFMAIRDTAILLMLFDTGVRRSELAYLKVGDVDLDNNLVDVIGKGNRPRRMPIGHRVAQALDRYLRVRAQHRLAQPEQDAFGLAAAGRWAIRRRPDAAPACRGSGCQHPCAPVPAHLRPQLACQRWTGDRPVDADGLEVPRDGGSVRTLSRGRAGGQGAPAPVAGGSTEVAAWRRFASARRAACPLSDSR
ncbi:MAG: tyrosine-type recombinase/integrase [Chloroflexi bacterium]|nr:tyrosine-type recombinase/integrase [Chloroflexota bacterium]